MVTRSTRSMMIIVILLLIFSNVGSCDASRPLSATSNGIDVAQVAESTNKLVNYLNVLRGATPPPGQTTHS